MTLGVSNFVLSKYLLHIEKWIRKVDSAIQRIMIFQLLQKGVKTRDIELAKDKKTLP